ncbi:hypothetical protein OLI37_004360 [Salmonella enterica]|nr:hypothetical protein [Salmonella enterica]EAQ2351431.1 hypothetical protein [Salmonella enterica]EKA4447872.1 hypothetical protein [Salmonella enterica]
MKVTRTDLHRCYSPISFTVIRTERLIQKGALEVAREIACRLRDMGWTPERIQEATGLSGEELKKLFPDEQ